MTGNIAISLKSAHLIPKVMRIQAQCLNASKIHTEYYIHAGKTDEMMSVNN